MPHAALLRVAGRPQAMRVRAEQTTESHRNELTFQTGRRRNQSCIHKSLLAYIDYEQTLGFDH